MENWTLHRIGFDEPVFALQNHVPIIRIGRANEVHKQCLGKQISRLHLECHKYQQQDGRSYWKIIDPGSSSHVCVNGYVIPQKEMVPLNDKDLISLGGNHTVDEVQGEKRLFVYRVNAPTSWENSAVDTAISTINSTQCDPGAGTDAEGESDTSVDILASLDKYEEELNPAMLLTEKEIKKEPEDKDPKNFKPKEKPKPKSKQETMPKATKESKPEVRLDSKPEVKTAEKSEVKSDAKPEIKTDKKLEVKTAEKPEVKITKTGSSEKKRRKDRKLLFSSDEEESSNSDSEENIPLKHKAKRSIEQISKKMFNPSSKMVKEALRQNKFGGPSLPIEDLQPPQNSTTARVSKIKGGAYKVKKWIVTEKIESSSSENNSETEENEVVFAGNFSQNDEVIEVLDSDEEKEFLSKSFNCSDKSKEPFDDQDHDHSDAESKSEGEEIGLEEQEIVMKPDFVKPHEVVKSDSSDDELEASQMSLYKKIRQSIKKTNSKDGEPSPPAQSAASFLPNNAPCDEYWNNDKLSDNESSGSESLPVARTKTKKGPKILESDSDDGSDNLGIEPFEMKRSCPYCPGIISDKNEDRLSRLMQNHIKKEHPEKFSMENISKEPNKEKQQIEGIPTPIKKRIGLLMSSDDNDSDDKDEVFEDDDGIPSFDEEEPRTPQRKPKISKLSKKKRLSNDQVQKVLDSSDEDTPIKKRPEKALEKPKESKEPGDVVDIKNQELAGPKSVSRNLTTKELSEMVNQQSPKEKVQRKIQVIDAIAQPPRHAKNRGISVTTINKMSEPKETIPAVPSTSKWLSKPKDRPAANKLNLKAKEKPEKYSFEIDPPDKLRKDTLKDIRKEKLEQLALKEKEAKKEEEKP